jgi:hypothetical protein
MVVLQTLVSRLDVVANTVLANWNRISTGIEQVRVMAVVICGFVLGRWGGVTGPGCRCKLEQLRCGVGKAGREVKQPAKPRRHTPNGPVGAMAITERDGAAAAARCRRSATCAAFKRSAC